MNRIEFARVIGFVTAAIGKPLGATPRETSERTEAYYRILGDLTFDVFLAAAERVVVEHPWPNFPLPAEFRAAAADIQRGLMSELTAGEAWKLAWGAACKIDLEQEGSVQRATRGMPAIVVEAMEAFGVPALCHGKDPVGVMRGQFIKIFEQLQARDRRRALLPATVKQQIALQREPAKVVQAVAQITVLPGGGPC